MNLAIGWIVVLLVPTSVLVMLFPTGEPSESMVILFTVPICLIMLAAPLLLGLWAAAGLRARARRKRRRQDADRSLEGLR